MATTKPRSRIHPEADAPLIELIPLEKRATRRRRTPKSERLEGSVPAPSITWVKVESLDDTVRELSAASMDDCAAVLRAAIRRQPIPLDRVVRLAYLGAQWLGTALYQSLVKSPSPPRRGK